MLLIIPKKIQATCSKNLEFKNPSDCTLQAVRSRSAQNGYHIYCYKTNESSCWRTSLNIWKYMARSLTFYWIGGTCVCLCARARHLQRRIFGFFMFARRIKGKSGEIVYWKCKDKAINTCLLSSLQHRKKNDAVRRGKRRLVHFASCVQIAGEKYLLVLRVVRARQSKAGSSIPKNSG